MKDRVMINKLILLLLVLVASFPAGARPKIAVSITPVASILKMLTGDAAEIITINKSAGCPHHYQMKPSDKSRFSDAEMLIFIDEKFDGFAGKLASQFQGEIVQISEIDDIDFSDDQGKINWHFWLDLDNVIILSEYLAKIIIEKFPELKGIVDINGKDALVELRTLAQVKKITLSSLSDLVVLSDSLEHFFKNSDAKILKLYQRTHSSLRDVKKLSHALGKNKNQCIVIDAGQNPLTYVKFDKKIIQLDSENWVVEKNDPVKESLFCVRYLRMLNQLQECSH
ncbi:MAG: hypothetical protein COA94_03650 [Rickettsiales bacterium]|nr:MAG: hypothetical protein COA94_03650 [Rickettsiales bacterium]